MRVLLPLIAVIAIGCGDDGGGKVYRESPEPNDGDPLLLGTGGTYTIAGHCAGEDDADSDGFIAMSDGGEPFISLDLEWDVVGASGSISGTVGSDTMAPGEDSGSAELGAPWPEGEYAFVNISCDAGGDFTYRGKFGFK